MERQQRSKPTTDAEFLFGNPATESPQSVTEIHKSATETFKSVTESPISETEVPNPATENETTKKESRQVKPMTPDREFRMQLNKFEKTIVKLVTDNGVSLDKFVAVVENAVRKNPDLLTCERQTLFASILTAAEFGLEPNTPAQHCWIIPYNNRQKGVKEAQFQFGYHGIVELLYRNPRILKIKTEVVYKNDEFDRWMDESMDWRFLFRPREDNRGDLRGIFAVVNIEGTDPEFKYMSLKELNEIRAKSKKPEMYSLSNDPQMWMYKKAVIKQIAKLLPKSAKIERALTIDSQIEGGETLTMADGRPVILTENRPKQVTRQKITSLFNVTDIEPN